MKKGMLGKSPVVLVSIFVFMLFFTAANAQTVKPDAIVIGSGASGMAAALTLAEGGAKVIVLEKMPSAGGISNYAEGIFAAESEMQRRERVRVTKDQAFRDIMEYNHWRANAALVRAIVDKSASTIDWLTNQGVEFIGIASMWENQLPTWHLFKGYGGSMIKVLTANAAKKGVEIRYDTPVAKIVREGNGPVTGVIIQDKTGKETRVDAKAVVIATGGYANNKEWIKKYTGFDLEVNLFPVANVNHTGDGIRMAWEAGAAEEGIEVLQLDSIGPVGPGIKLLGHIMAAALQPYLWINQDGKRFCDESIARSFTFTGNAVSRQKGGYFFAIFDEGTKQYLLSKGIDMGVGEFVPVTTRLTNLEAEIKTALEKGNPNIFVAETLDELAGKMGVDPTVFRKTVEEYNKFCEKGHDGKFAKDRRFLLPVKTAKFYAFKSYTGFLGTLGGIKTNEKMEVLDKNEDIIPGLYAVGNDVGGMYGDSYDLVSSGGTMGFAVNSGRIAGDNAIKYVGK